MNLSMLLLSIVLTTAGDKPDAAARPVFRGTAADGTVLFSDRPSTVLPRGAVAASPLSLPPGNIIAAPVAPIRAPSQAGPSARSSRAAVPDQKRRVEAGDGNATSNQACRRMRTRLAALWQERRQGYAADRGQELKRSIRRLQSRMKAQCGHWR